MYSSSVFLLAVICAILNQAFLVSTLFDNNLEAANGKNNLRTTTEIPEEHLKPINIESYRTCDFNLCSYDENYPVKNITNLVTNTEILKKFFHFDTTNQMPTGRTDQNNEEELCETRLNIYYPRVMLNVHKKWKYVVNLDDEPYKQSFEAETCRYLDSDNTNDIKEICESRLGHKCRQNYQNLTLITYEDGSLGFDIFEVPTTCECSGCS